MNRTLKAYTVIELIVVMLISGITITIAYRGFEIFQRLFLSFKYNGTQVSDLAFFNRILAEDIHRSDYVYKTIDGISCLSIEKQNSYIFYEDKVIRKGVRLDTFIVNASEVTCYLLKKEQNEVGSLIDRISIVSYNAKDTLYFNSSKIYGANILMQLEKKD